MAGGGFDLLILDSRLLWQTVSNAAVKSTDTQTVRSGGFFWLNPIAMSVVNCNIAEVVECSCLKPCWSGAGTRYVLMVGRIRGHRSDICRYEDPWEVCFSGLGMINEDFHIAGIGDKEVEEGGRGVSYQCNRCSGWVHAKCYGLLNAAQYRRSSD